MKQLIIFSMLVLMLLNDIAMAQTWIRSDRREQIANNMTTLATNRNNGYREKITDDLTMVAIVDTPDGYSKDVDTVWRYGGASEDGNAVWGFFYVDPQHVWWGSYNNPELYVKIWFDPSGRIDVNYFHVSYDDILIRTGVGYNSGWIGDVKGTATRYERFVQHRLDSDGSRYYESERE